MAELQIEVNGPGPWVDILKDMPYIMYTLSYISPPPPKKSGLRMSL